MPFMGLWPLLVIAFMVQEPVSSNTLLLAAYQRHYAIWLLTLVFIAATALDAVIAFFVGSFLKRRFARSRFARFVERKAEQFNRFSGRYGKRFAILVLGPFFFPYSAVAAPWLRLSLLETVVLSVIGDTVIWYGSEWAIILGIHAAVPDPLLALAVTAGVSLIFAFAVRHFFLRKR